MLDPVKTKPSSVHGTLGSVQLNHPVVSDSLWPHELQIARLPCLSPTPRAYSNSCTSSWWCHPNISSSSSLSPSAFNLSQHQGLFKWVSSSHQVAKVLEVQLQHQSFQWTPKTDRSPLGRTGWISLQAKGFSRVFSNTTVQKPSILWRSAFFIVQLSHPYMTTGRTIALTRCPFVGKVMSLLFNMLSRLVITFLPRSKYLLMSWLQWPSAMILESPQIQSVTVSTVSPSICHEVMDPAPRVLTTILISLLKVGKLRHKSVTWLERRTGQHVCRAAVRQGASLLILTADPSGTRVLPWRAWSQTAKREGEFTPKGLDFLLQEPVVFYLFFNLCLLLLLLLFIVIILIFATWLLPSGYCRAST